MSAFDDSQKDTVNSQDDLFLGQQVEQDTSRPAPENHISSEISSVILAKLTSLEKIVKVIQADVEHLKSNTNTSKAFSMDDCSFKKRLNAFLKEKFTRNPWLNAQTDLAFKNEVQKCLRIDGVGERNNVAYKVVCQYAAQRYTEYRNQLRRKLIADIKAGKDVQSSAIDKFAEDYLAVYLSAGQQSDSRDRMQLCIILRSFLHTKKLNLDGSDSLEFYCNFWQTFKEYHDKTMKDIKNDAKRMDKLQEIDSRRRLQRLDAANRLKNSISKIKDQIHVVEKRIDNFHSVSQGSIMFPQAEAANALKYEIREFKDHLEVIERRHNEIHDDLTCYTSISKDKMSVVKANEDDMYVLEKRLEMIYFAFQSLRNWNQDETFPNLTEKIRDGLDIFRLELQNTLIAYGSSSFHAEDDINSIENKLGKIRYACQKIGYACENFCVGNKAADTIYMIKQWIKATKDQIEVIREKHFHVFYGTEDDNNNIIKSKLEKIRFACEKIGYACQNSGVWNEVSDVVFMIQRHIKAIKYQIDVIGKQTLYGISDDINIIESKLEKIRYASVGKKVADAVSIIQWRINAIKYQIDFIGKNRLYDADAVFRIQWKIEAIKDDIDVIGENPPFMYLRRKSEAGNSKHIRISTRDNWLCNSGQLYLRTKTRKRDNMSNRKENTDYHGLFQVIDIVITTVSVKMLEVILMLFVLIDLHQNYKKDQSFDGRMKIEKGIFWSVDLSSMQLKNEQKWNARNILSGIDCGIHGQEEKRQVNIMRMRFLVGKG